MGMMVAALGVPGASAQAQFLNGIAAIVNDTVITVREVRIFIAPAVELLQRQYASQASVLAQKQQQTLEDGITQLIERRLILDDLKTSGRNLPESIIDEEINRNIRERFGDRLTLTKTLQAEGITYESFRQQTRERIIVNALRDLKVSSALIVSPYKIEAYYATNQDQFKVEDQVKLRMIEVSKASTNFADPKKGITEILAKINAGTPFAQMANFHEGSQPGGEWGWVERSVLRKELAEVAFNLKPGEHSGVLEVERIYYLMQVEERRPAQIRPLMEVREEIEKSLLVQERAKLQKKWIDRLKSKAFVRFF